MATNNSPSDEIGDGTLRLPTKVDDSGSSPLSPNDTPAGTDSGSPHLSRLAASTDTDDGLSDPMATAFFDSSKDSNKQLSFDGDSSRQANKDKIANLKPQPKLDKIENVYNPVVEIPGFKIRNELGRGAFGVVYRAYDEMLDREVAIKVPLLGDPALQKQYIDEARKAVRLEHPGIVQTYHVGVTASGQPFVVQKLIEGTTLRALIKERGGALSLGEALGILRPVCHALESAHAIGLVHRDLKPENLLIDLAGRPFVADFGLAVSDDEDLSGRTEVAGTPLYMSPEQFSGRTQWLDGRSDIWAIGVIFYEIVVGKSPFYAESMRELREQILEKDPRPIHQRQPNIPASFDAIFRKCCAKQTSNRFGSIRELIDAFDHAIDELPEQSILELMPELQKNNQSRRIGSQNLSSAGLPKGKRLSSANQPAWDSHISTSSRLARAWNLFGPLIAIACTVGAMTWMYFISDRVKVKESEVAVAPSTQQTVSASHQEEPGQTLLTTPESTQLTPSDNLSTSLSANASSALPSATNPSTQLAVVTNAASSTTLAPSEPTSNGLSAPAGMKNGSAATVNLPSTPAPTLPLQKPYRVSLRTGDGTHDNLADAIAESSSGDTVIMLEGTYRVPIIVDKDIKIVGEGEKHNVILQTEGVACLTIRNNANVQLENLKLKTNRADTEQANTIDVELGNLRLEKCFVVSNSYNCIKLRNETKLVARNSDFQSSEHATIRAENGTELEVDGCDFILHPDSDDSLKKVCIQAEGAVGKIKNSRFKGPCTAGIEWRDQTSGEILVESCSFSEIRLAVSLTNCTDVVLRGDKKYPLALKNCDDSIWIRNSTVSIDGAQITGNRTDLKKGVAAQKKSIVSMKGSLISGFQTGVAVDHSKISIEDTAVRDSTERNLRAYSSDVTLEDVELVGTGPNGLHSSGDDSSLTINAALISNTTSGLWVESGKISLNQVLVRDCTVGIIAGINADMAKLFMDGQSDDSAADRPSSDVGTNIVKLSGTELTLSACDKGFVFMSPGTMAISNVKDDFNTDGKKRISTRSSDLVGVGDYAKFEANWRSIRDRE